MSVSNTHPAYDLIAPTWSKMADVVANKDAIIAKGITYLPRLKHMTDDEYEAYCKRASFPMFTKRTIEAFVGMVMRKRVQTSGVTITNIDGKGGTIDSYVNHLLDHFLTYNRCGTLVDVPAVDESIVSVADAEEKNIRPRLVFYSHSNIINWRVKRINNVEVLSRAVLRETIERETADEFSVEETVQYRVLDLDENGEYRQRVFDDSGAPISVTYPVMNGQRMKFIPFVIHGGIKVKYPVLLGVADENLSYYRLDADYKHGLHFVALPTPYMVVPDPSDEDLPSTVGPTRLWKLPLDSTAGMLEFTGAGLDQIRKAKEETIEIIVILASRILSPEKSSNDESALAAAIRSNAETSTLAGITRTLSHELLDILQIAVKWDGGNKDKVKVVVNSDFMPSNLSGTDMLSYVTAWIKGGISYESLFNVLKRGEIIEGDREIDAELKDINEEQKKRLADEVEKAEKLGKVENKEEEKEELVPDTDVEIKPDLKLK